MQQELKIGIVGYGQMGRMVEEMAKERGHTIAFIADSEHSEWADADVLIEFSRPSAVRENISKAMTLGLPMVTGTTGWNEELADVKNEVERRDGALLHASNFSIGVNAFFALNEHLARLLSSHLDYKAEISETHHTKKKDSPSGTAITLGEGIQKEHPEYHQWENNETVEPGVLPIQSFREPGIPGTHIIRWENGIDSIELKHEAKNRRGFAQGATLAAEWIIGKKGVFTMKDVLQTH